MMKPKQYPESISGNELDYIQKFLLTSTGTLKAPAIKSTPVQIKHQIISAAKDRGLDSENISECIYWITHDLRKYPKHCIACDNPITKFHTFSSGYPHDRCSLKCSNSDKSVQAKKKATSLKTYGTEYPWQSDDIKKKAKSAFRDKWFEKRFTQFLPEYVPVTTREEFKGSKVKFEWKHSVCGHIFTEYMSWRDLKPMCPACREDFKITRPQRDITEYVKSLYSGPVITNDRRTIWPLELDIFIPEKNIAIEFNGLYWHSFDRMETKDEREKHMFKSDACAALGIKLIQIWEHEWEEQSRIVEARLKSSLGFDSKIYARNCELREIDARTAKVFLDEHHIQGSAVAKIKLGLFHKNDLVACMTFGKPRFSKKYQWELIRYCSKGTIVGGASKLLSHFIKQNNPESIVSYADRRWSDGRLYRKLGFDFVNKSTPNYFYFKGDKRFSRYDFQKHKLDTILERFDPVKSESCNAFDNGFRRAWDAGNFVFVWTSHK